MRIIAAGTFLPHSEEKTYFNLKDKPYYFYRPKANNDDLMVEMALPVCKKVLNEAETSADEIDMILSISISPDHLFKSKEMAAPRMCHPLQRELGAKKAFVFDLIDADWSLAIDIANGFMKQLKYKKVLIVRTEVTAFSVKPDQESGFDHPDGVGVLLLQKSNDDLKTKYLSISDEDLNHVTLKMLPPEEMSKGSLKGFFTLEYDKNLVSIMDEKANQLLSEFKSEESKNFEAIVESWLPLQGELINKQRACLQGLGPFTLPYYLQKNLNEQREWLQNSDKQESYLLSITLNPFTMRYGAQLLCFAPRLKSKQIKKSIFI